MLEFIDSLAGNRSNVDGVDDVVEMNNLRGVKLEEGRK